MVPRSRVPILKAGIAALVVSLLYLVLIRPFSLLEIPNLKVQDLLLALRHGISAPPKTLSDFVLIAVDDESIERIGQRWPFQRRFYADLIEKISRLHPRLIGIDFIFSGRGEPMDDFLLSEAIRRSGNVVLASYVDHDGNHVTPLDDIRKSALGYGVINKSLDRDLFLRRAYLSYRDAAGAIVAWPWEIEILIPLFKLDRAQYQISDKGIQFDVSEAGSGTLLIPSFDSRGTMINFRFDLNDLEAIPLWQVMERKDLEGRLNHKVVFVGATSRMIHDLYHTPLGLMPGIVVNMNLVSNILMKDLLRKTPLIIDLLFVAALTFLGVYLSTSQNVARGIIFLGASSLGLFAVYLFLFHHRYLGEMTMPALSGWLLFLSISLYRYFKVLIENVQLRGKVITDPLTGLFNRRVLEVRIDEELDMMSNQRGARKTDVVNDLAVLMIDVDNFKQVNDRFGHQFGDDVLKNVSFTIKENIRKDDLAARYGGEEFCVVLPHTTKEEATKIAEKIRVSLAEKKLSYVNRTESFTISIGLASAKADGLLASRALIRAADQALYEAKRKGKNQVTLYKGSHS